MASTIAVSLISTPCHSRSSGRTLRSVTVSNNFSVSCSNFVLALQINDNL